MGAEPQLIETIRIQNGRVCNIHYHNLRCNASRNVLFGSTDSIDLRSAIDTSDLSGTEIKCRITYDEIVRKIEFETYSFRPIQTLKIIEVDDYDYSFKYADRNQLQAFYEQRGDKDDILMTRNGFLTDTYYANVALLQEGKWYSPKFPLLKGIRRAQLLQKERIIETEIHKDQIKEYEAITLFNAMIPFRSITIKNLSRNIYD
jgi:4-amino-4-deoxychorismate lyase